MVVVTHKWTVSNASGWDLLLTWEPGNIFLNLRFMVIGTERHLKSTVMTTLNSYMYTSTLVLSQRYLCMNRHFKCDEDRSPSVRIEDDGKASQIYKRHWMAKMLPSVTARRSTQSGWRRPKRRRSRIRLWENSWYYLQASCPVISGTRFSSGLKPVNSMLFLEFCEKITVYNSNNLQRNSLEWKWPYVL